MKLYKVEAYAYVIARDGAEALEILSRSSILPLDNGMTVEVYQVTSVDAEWWGLLPFGSAGEESSPTCGQIITDVRTSGLTIVGVS